MTDALLKIKLYLSNLCPIFDKSLWNLDGGGTVGILPFSMYVCCQCSVYRDTSWSLKLAEFENYFLQLMYHSSALYFSKGVTSFLEPRVPDCLNCLLLKKAFLLFKEDGG